MATNTTTILSILFLLVNINFCCEVHDTFLKCETVRQIKRQEYSSNSETVLVKNTDKRFTPINADSFKKIPKVNSLTLDGITNQIEDAFDNLPQLQELVLKNNNLPVLYTNIFGTNHVRNLVIENCQVEDIKMETFRSLQSLTVLRIEGNLIRRIKQFVFSGTRLESLHLPSNKIQFIDNNAFQGMNYLELLNLTNNKLTHFDTRILLGGTPSLKSLTLSKNLLKSLPVDVFYGTDNLRDLDLSHNQLRAVSSGCFKDLKQLSMLNLANNKIRELPRNLFPLQGLRSLKVFYLHENQLCFLDPEIYNNLLPNLNSISYGGNPWQCPCWVTLDKWITLKKIHRICHDVYKAGKHPECIYAEFSECVYNQTLLESLPDLYLQETAAYPKLTDCV